MPTLADIPAAPSTSAENGAFPLGVASSLPKQGTASNKIHFTASHFHINGQAAPHSHTEVQQDQAGPAQAQAHNSTLSHYIRSFFPSEFLTQFPMSLATPPKANI